MLHPLSDSEIQSIAAALATTFAGRHDVYGLGMVNPETNKARYVATYAPVTPQLLEAHVRGEQLVGIYPLVEGTVRWAAVDFDAAKNEAGAYVDADPFAAAFEQAQTQLERFKALGLFGYLERSRSGTGVHLWLFFDDWVSGAAVRALLEPALVDSALLDRMYPVQAEAVTGKGLGNLICLPFHGEAMRHGFGSFVDPDLGVPVHPARFLAELRTNSAVVVRELGERALAARPARSEKLQRFVRGDLGVEINAEGLRPPRPLASGVYKLLSPYGCEFMRQAWEHRRTLGEPAWYAVLGQLTCFERGREAAHIFSRDYRSYSAQETDAKFDQALRNPPVGCQFIHENFPKMACKSCPMTAPYRRAEVQLNALHRESSTGMKQGGFTEKLAKIRDYDSGKTSSGIAWGLGGSFDQRVRARPGELCVIGALPSVGKTSLLVHKASSLGGRGIPARVFSAETGEDPLYFRFLSHRAGVDSRALRGERLSGRLTREEHAALERAAASLDRDPVTFNYNVTAAEQMYIGVEERQLVEGCGFDDPFDVLFDYLQFGQREPGDASDYEKVSRLIRDLKTLAKVLRAGHVDVFSQLTRKSTEDKEPALNWFRDSGRIEADVDTAIIIHGERVEGRHAPRALHVLKQKESEANLRVEFVVDQATCTYEPARVPESDKRPDLLAQLNAAPEAAQLGLHGEHDE